MKKKGDETMSKSRNLYERVVWITYVFYLFTIVAFGDRKEYYMISNMTFIVLMGLMCLYILLRKAFKAPKLIFSFLPFVLFAYISYIWSYIPSDTLVRASTILKVVILMIVLSYYLFTTEETMNFIYGFAVSGFLALIYTVSFYGISGLIQMMRENTRVGTDIVNANFLAVYLAISAVILFYECIKRKKVLLLIPVIALIAMIALTGSKKGLMDLAVGLALVLFLTKQNEINKYTKWLVRIVIIGAALFVFWNSSLFMTVRVRLEGIGGLFSASKSLDYSTIERQKMLIAGLEQFIATPVLGIGIGASGYVTLIACGYSSYLHNNFVELLASGGLVGTLLYYIPFVKILISNWKIRDFSEEAYLSFLILFIELINGMASVQYFSKPNFIEIAIAVSSLIIYRFNQNKEYEYEQ